ncbi:unnamed protein product [Cunninghamella blakesleeana]
MPLSIQSNRTNHTNHTTHTNQQHTSSASLSIHSNNNINNNSNGNNSNTNNSQSTQQQRESLASSSSSTSSTSTTTGNGRWVIYVISGHHHGSQSQHPALARLSDNPTYEDLLWLSNMIGPARPTTTTQQAIDAALPVHSWSDEDTKKAMLQDTEKCLVCLDDFVPKQSVRVLKCRHVFHVECVDRWLVESHNSCPSCRKPATNTNATNATNAI